MAGWLRYNRDRFQTELWADEPYCRGYAFDWLVAQALFADAEVEINRAFYALKRGQASYSIRFLAEKWGWSKSKVQRFLKDLEAAGFIEMGSVEAVRGTARTGKRGTAQSVVTICGYEEFSVSAEKSGTPELSDRGTPRFCGTASGTPKMEKRGTPEMSDRGTPENPASNGKETENSIDTETRGTPRIDERGTPKSSGRGTGSGTKNKQGNNKQNNRGQNDLFDEGEEQAKPQDPVLRILAEVMTVETARSFISHRNQLKKKLTGPGAKIIANKLRGRADADVLVHRSIERGWLSVFPTDHPAPQPRPSSQSSDQPSGLLRRMQGR